MKASTKISKEDLGGQARCGRVMIPVDAPERAVCDAVRRKPKL